MQHFPSPIGQEHRLLRMSPVTGSEAQKSNPPPVEAGEKKIGRIEHREPIAGEEHVLQSFTGKVHVVDTHLAQQAARLPTEWTTELRDSEAARRLSVTVQDITPRAEKARQTEPRNVAALQARAPASPGTPPEGLDAVPPLTTPHIAVPQKNTETSADAAPAPKERAAAPEKTAADIPAGTELSASDAQFYMRYTQGEIPKNEQTIARFRSIAPIVRQRTLTQAGGNAEGTPPPEEAPGAPPKSPEDKPAMDEKTMAEDADFARIVDENLAIMKDPNSSWGEKLRAAFQALDALVKRWGIFMDNVWGDKKSPSAPEGKDAREKENDEERRARLRTEMTEEKPYPDLLKEKEDAAEKGKKEKQEQLTQLERGTSEAEIKRNEAQGKVQSAEAALTALPAEKNNSPEAQQAQKNAETAKAELKAAQEALDRVTAERNALQEDLKKPSEDEKDAEELKKMKNEWDHLVSATHNTLTGITEGIPKDSALHPLVGGMKFVPDEKTLTPRIELSMEARQALFDAATAAGMDVSTLKISEKGIVEMKDMEEILQKVKEIMDRQKSKKNKENKKDIPPAKDAPTGQIRQDTDGNYWKKGEDRMWHSVHDPEKGMTSGSEAQGVAWSNATMDKYTARIVEEEKKIHPAKEAPLGEIRQDKEGNYWIKGEKGWTSYNAEGMTSDSGYERTTWGDTLMDERTGSIVENFGAKESNPEKKEMKEKLQEKVKELNEKMDKLKERFKELPDTADEPLPMMISNSVFELQGDKIVNIVNPQGMEGARRITRGIGYKEQDTNNDGTPDQFVRGNETVEVRSGSGTFDLSELVPCDGLPMERQAEKVSQALDDFLVAFSRDVDVDEANRRFAESVERGDYHMRAQVEKPGEYKNWNVNAVQNNAWKDFAKSLPEEMRRADRTLIGKFLEGARIVTDSEGKQMIAMDAKDEALFKSLLVSMVHLHKSDYVEHRSGENTKEIGFVLDDRNLQELKDVISLRFTGENPSRLSTQGTILKGKSPEAENPAAKDAPTGQIRQDTDGNYWKKGEDRMWHSVHDPEKGMTSGSEAKGLSWPDATMDEHTARIVENADARTAAPENFPPRTTPETPSTNASPDNVPLSAEERQKYQEIFKDVRKQRETYEAAYRSNPTMESVQPLIKAIEAEIQAAESAGVDAAGIEALQEKGRWAYHEYGALKMMAVRQEVEDIIKREESTIHMAEGGRKESGWFGWLDRNVWTGSDVYKIDIDTSTSKRDAARHVQERIIATAEQELHKGPEHYDPQALEDLLARAEANVKILTKTDMDSSRYDDAQEALSASRDASIAVITLPLAFVGSSATAGSMGAARLGAAQGARTAAVASGAGNMEDVQRGAKTVGEATRDTAVDTATGAAVGAAAGAAAPKIGSALRSAKEKVGSAVRSAKDRVAAASQARNAAAASPQAAAAPRGATSRPASGARTSPPPEGSPRTNPNSQRTQANRNERGRAPEKSSTTDKTNPKQPDATRRPFEPLDPTHDLDNPHLLPEQQKEVAYRILGLEKGASVDAVNKAYQKLQWKYHPDKLGQNPGLSPMEKDIGMKNFKTITDARDKILGRNQ